MGILLPISTCGKRRALLCTHFNLFSGVPVVLSLTSTSTWRTLLRFCCLIFYSRVRNPWSSKIAERRGSTRQIVWAYGSNFFPSERLLVSSYWQQPATGLAGQKYTIPTHSQHEHQRAQFSTISGTKQLGHERGTDYSGCPSLTDVSGALLGFLVPGNRDGD